MKNEEELWEFRPTITPPIAICHWTKPTFQCNYSTEPSLQLDMHYSNQPSNTPLSHHSTQPTITPPNHRLLHLAIITPLTHHENKTMRDTFHDSHWHSSKFMTHLEPMDNLLSLYLNKLIKLQRKLFENLIKWGQNYFLTSFSYRFITGKQLETTYSYQKR